jgi:hypothetical protein
MKSVFVLLAIVAVAFAAPHDKNAKPAAFSTKHGVTPVVLWHPSGNIILGVQDSGDLNVPTSAGFGVPSSIQGTSTVGSRLVDTTNAIGRGVNAQYEATAAGCTCEAWGASYRAQGSTSTVVGYANTAEGAEVGVTFSPIVPDATCFANKNAASCTHAMTDAQVTCLRVQHNFQPSAASAFAYEVTVTMTNDCTFPIGHLRYQRSMDWDIEPAAFSEKVILNAGTAADLLCLHDDGFCTGNPEDAGCTGRSTGCVPAATEITEIILEGAAGDVDSGVSDHGATFRFQFASITNDSPLAVGAAKVFKVFYGAAPSQAKARTELDKLNPEAYSLGVYAGSGLGPTHFFAFAGIGGSVIISDPTACGASCAAEDAITGSTACTVGSMAASATGAGGSVKLCFAGTCPIA